MSIEQDIATLRDAVWAAPSDLRGEYRAALSRVVSEVERLDRDLQEAELAGHSENTRAVAAEAVLRTANAELERLREGLRRIGCVGDHYCPGNPNFLGDVWSEEGEYDPAKWPLCAVCALLSVNEEGNE